MSTNNYRVTRLYGEPEFPGDREIGQNVDADGFRVKDDGWIHFYVDGPTPDAPKETTVSLSPQARVVSIEKVNR